MAGGLTIYADKPDYEAVVTAIRRVGLDCDLDGVPASWQRITARGRGNSTVTFTSKVWREGGDEVSHIILGTASAVDRVKTWATRTRAELITRIAYFHFLIGVVASPDFDADPRFAECALKVAHALGGIVFTGHSILEGTGQLILDLDGNSGVPPRGPSEWVRKLIGWRSTAR